MSQDIIRLLQHNVGFEQPERWADYARAHHFESVRAIPVPRCPDCGGSPKASRGQFVYYSTLLRLLECPACELIWADARIDAAVIRQHFETTYKDDTYFEEERARIFAHLAGLIDELAPPGSRVLDIGGAKGHLMHRLSVRRGDLRLTVHDVSRAATEWARERWGFETICGDLDVLEEHSNRYDVIVLSDVLYYEPDLRRLWDLLGRLLAPNGSLVIRVPNKKGLILAAQRAFELCHPPKSRTTQSAVRFYNPEHLYILGRRYLVRRLRQLGFAQIRVLPSPLLSSSFGGSVYFRLTSVMNAMSGGKLVLTPGMVVIGKGRGFDDGR
ncbi:MAG TPA: methyltransferase domain-containing protein [Vicinamibacterales bacterium]|nr:methyltransferase domain-containing protein [Vicinamibacterales bacterium]